MTFFFALLIKVIPLYLNIILGYIGGKFLKVDRETIAKIMFYMLTPLVIFNGVIHTKLDTSILLLPFITFLISCTLCYMFYQFAGMIWHDSLRNLVAFSAGTANSGYFGLPIAVLLFDDQGEGIYIMALLGMTLYENSVGYYTISRGSHSVSECFAQLATLPSLYAFLVALVVNYFQIPIPEVFADFGKHIKSTYTVLGMMIIGIGLAGLVRLALDFKFIGMTFLARFFFWPVAVGGVIALDLYVFGFFDNEIYKALMLIATVPLAANMVVLATLFKTYPEKAATAVFLSTLFAIFYIPLMVSYFISSF